MTAAPPSHASTATTLAIPSRVPTRPACPPNAKIGAQWISDPHPASGLAYLGEPLLETVAVVKSEVEQPDGQRHAQHPSWHGRREFESEEWAGTAVDYPATSEVGVHSGLCPPRNRTLAHHGYDIEGHGGVISVALVYHRCYTVG